MVSAEVLNQISKRLQQAFQTALPFGRVSIVWFGDLCQLAPVIASLFAESDKVRSRREEVDVLWAE